MGRFSDWITELRTYVISKKGFYQENNISINVLKYLKSLREQCECGFYYHG